MSFDVRDDSALQYLPPNSDQDNADAAPIARGGLPNQQTSRDHPVEQTRAIPPVVRATSPLSRHILSKSRGMASCGIPPLSCILVHSRGVIYGVAGIDSLLWLLAIS